MPTFSLIEVFKITIKMVLIGLITGLLLSFSREFMALATDLIGKVGGSMSAVNGLDMGWFGGAIGMTDFLNALMQSAILGGHTLVGGIISIFSFKYGVQFYAYLMKV